MSGDVSGYSWPPAWDGYPPDRTKKVSYSIVFSYGTDASGNRLWAAPRTWHWSAARQRWKFNGDRRFAWGPGWMALNHATLVGAAGAP